MRNKALVDQHHQGADDLLGESLCCGLSYLRHCHAKGTFMYISKVAIVDVQGIMGG